MNAKLFSIITPTYNCEKDIEKTINSVLSQKKLLFEYIIIDNNSNDSTLDILNKYKDKIKLTVEYDNGIYDAMNKGIDIAKGKYLYFLGAGDCLRKNILFNLARIIPKKGINFIYGNICYLHQNNQIINNYGFNKWNITTNSINHQSIFYAREIFQILGKYKLQYKIAADYCKNIEAFGNDYVKKIYVNAVIADYKGNGMSDKLKDKIFLRENSKIIIDNLGLKYYVYFVFRDIAKKIIDFFKLKRIFIIIFKKMKLRI